MSPIGLLQDQEIMIGAIDVVRQSIETAEDVEATIREAMQYADADRVLPCSNCGLAPLPRHVAEAKLKAPGGGARLAPDSLT